MNRAKKSTDNITFDPDQPYLDILTWYKIQISSHKLNWYVRKMRGLQREVKTKFKFKVQKPVIYTYNYKSRQHNSTGNVFAGVREREREKNPACDHQCQTCRDLSYYFDWECQHLGILDWGIKTKTKTSFKTWTELLREKELKIVDGPNAFSMR